MIYGNLIRSLQVHSKSCARGLRGAKTLRKITIGYLCPILQEEIHPPTNFWYIFSYFFQLKLITIHSSFLFSGRLLTSWVFVFCRRHFGARSRARVATDSVPVRGMTEDLQEVSGRSGFPPDKGPCSQKTEKESNIERQKQVR